MNFISSLPPYSAICLMGPTAVGKTQLSLEFAKNYPIEIISVDSAMVYEGLDIGTGKPTLSERGGIPHHLIDIRDPADPYSVAAFRTDALRLIQEIHLRGRIPLLVGGTMLYFRALQNGLSPLPSAHPEIRARLLAEANVLGWPLLHQRLADVDPESGARIAPNDPQRIQRALEVYERTGKPLSSFFNEKPKTRGQKPAEEKEVDFRLFALLPEDRAWLHERIAKRFQGMLEQGVIEEVAVLFQRGDLSPDLPAMRSVGYRQIWGYLEGRTPFEAMVEQAIAATRQLAKRQCTWLKSFSEAFQLKVGSEGGIKDLDSFQSVIHSLAREL